MQRVVVYGNSGSGKSTLAKRLVDEHGLEHLDLDTVAWESPGVRHPLEVSLQQLNSFIEQHDRWVIEGCYGSLVKAVLKHSTQLLFLNPGIDTCLRNNEARPWESHKYESPEQQNANLEMLQNWVREYENRDDEFSLQYHRAIFDSFDGNKQEITGQAEGSG